MLRLPKAAMAAMVLAAAGSLGGVQGAAAAGVPVLPAYFNPSDAGPFRPLIFMRQAPPPVDDRQAKANYAYGPITDSAALNVTAQNNSGWSGNNWPFVWANRARVPPGQNLIAANPIYPAIFDPHGNTYGVEFSTPARANAATKAEVLYIMGAPTSVWQAPIIAAGVTSVSWNTANADPNLYFTRTSQDGNTQVMVDRMVVPFAVSNSAYGITIDYEVQDERTSGDTHPFLDNLGATIRSYGLKAYLYTNPWDSPSTQRNGFAFSRMDDIKANFDYISLFVWGGQFQCDELTSFPYSVHFLKGASGKLNFNQIIVTVDLLNCSVADAVLISAQHALDNFAGYNIWDDGAQDGGSRLSGSNLVIWTLLHGG